MKILFVTPHGGYTGSEMLLWQLMQELTNRQKQVAWFSRHAGALRQEADQVAFPSQFYPQQPSFLRSVYDGIYLKAMGTLPVNTALLRFHRQVKPDVWYLNTGVMPDVAALARQLNVPYIVHFHELVSAFDDQPAASFLAMLAGARHLIGCSGIVQQRLLQLGFSQTQLMYSCIDHSRIQVRQQPAALRQQLGIPPDAFVWVMSGTASLRKGYDLVPDILAQLPPNAYLCWLGKPRESALHTYVEQRVTEENLRFVALGEQSAHYFDYLNMADGFALTSREDPFPLVMIEAAALGKPIAAFNSGGVSEFLQPGMGGVVNGLNPRELASLMQQIMAGKLPVAAAVSKARAAEFTMTRQADDFCRIVYEN
jgi:L-malate glycosyltransferase